MSKKSESLLASMLGNRWRAYTTAAAATATASVSAPLPTQRHHLETIVYSIHNRSGAGAVAFTIQAQVRHASVAGTVIFALDNLIPASTCAQVAITDLKLLGKRGTGLVAFFNTVLASVTATVNICGWTDDTNG